MLTREAFWDLIGTLGGAIDQERAQTLTDRLAEQTPADIVALTMRVERDGGAKRTAKALGI